jgi:predicted dehydrogenase
VLAACTPSPSGEAFESIFLDFGSGRAAQINLARAAEKRRDRLEIVAERGFVTLQGPNRLRWSQADREYGERFPGQRSPESRILRHFHRLVTETATDVPGARDARLTVRVLQATARSKAEGRVVSL